MKSFSGGTTFSFEIERYLDKSNGTYLTTDDSRVSEDDDFEFEYKAIILTVVGTASSVPAKLSGAWENCHPDESEFNIESVTDEAGLDWSDKLSNSENDELVTKLFEECESGAQDFDYEPYID